MAISSLIVDSLLKRNDRPHLLRCLARAIHAAVQARCLMPKRTEHALESTKVAVSLGIPQVTALLPGNQESAPDAQAPAMDSDLQLQILRELTQALAEKPDINEVCQLVIEGIHRAIGMQRVALLMTDRSGELLVPRTVGGRGTEEWREHFVIKKG